jgi:hypothetical protein
MFLIEILPLSETKPSDWAAESPEYFRGDMCQDPEASLAKLCTAPRVLSQVLSQQL